MEKFSVKPNQISHNEKPIFVANWFNGDIKAPEDDRKSFYYDGGGENDALLIYKIEWEDEAPAQQTFNSLMDGAISAIDHWISQRF